MIDKSAIQAAHPEWQIVDAIPAIDGSGGIWAVNAQGAVFALDANGNPSATGAKYLGAYNALPEAQRQGTRSFVGIRTDPDTGGYTLISNQLGQNYTFPGNGPIGGDQNKPKIDEPTKGIDFTQADQDGLMSALKAAGVGDLFSKAWDHYIDPNGGAGDQARTLTWLEETPEFQQHFPGLKETKDQGFAWTPANWNQYYNDIQEAAVTYGIPADFVSREDVGQMISGRVAKPEAIGRMQAAAQSVTNADPVVIQKMKDLGFTDGDLTAFYLDDVKGESLIDRKAKEGQARIAASAQRTGYDPNLSLGTAQNLQKLGVDEAAANQGFGQLYQERGLFANTAGETMAGSDITTEEQLGATFGNSGTAQEEIARRKAARQANFQGGGGSAGGSTGKTGLG